MQIDSNWAPEPDGEIRDSSGCQKQEFFGVSTVVEVRMVSVGGVIVGDIVFIGVSIVKELTSICLPNVKELVHIGVSTVGELGSIDILTTEGPASIGVLIVGELTSIGASTVGELVSVNTQASTLCFTTGSMGAISKIKGQSETMSFISTHLVSGLDSKSGMMIE
jgi:hypothetical protein